MQANGTHDGLLKKAAVLLFEGESTHGNHDQTGIMVILTHWVTVQYLSEGAIMVITGGTMGRTHSATILRLII